MEKILSVTNVLNGYRFTQEAPAQIEDVSKALAITTQYSMPQIEQNFINSPISKINWASQMVLMDSLGNQRSTVFGYTIVKDHLCSTHRHYMDRSPAYYIEQAGKRSEALMRLIKRNFEREDVPERIYRRCDALLSLQRKTDPVVFEKACLFAVEADMVSYKSLQRIIENKTYQWNETTKVESAKRLSHENIRGKEYYTNQLNQLKQTL